MARVFRNECLDFVRAGTTINMVVLRRFDCYDNLRRSVTAREFGRGRRRGRLGGKCCHNAVVPAVGSVQMQVSSRWKDACVNCCCR
jgi:hypothetical protein